MELTLYQAIKGFNDFSPFPNDKFYTSKLREFAVSNVMRMAESFPNGENTVGKKRRKLLVTSNFSFSLSVTKEAF